MFVSPSTLFPAYYHLLCGNCVLCVDNHIKLHQSSWLIKSPCLEVIPAPIWRAGLVLGPHSAPESRLRPSLLQSRKGGARHHWTMVVPYNAWCYGRLCSGLAVLKPLVHAARDGNGILSLIFVFLTWAMPSLIPRRMFFLSSSWSLNTISQVAKPCWHHSAGLAGRRKACMVTHRHLSKPQVKPSLKPSSRSQQGTEVRSTKALGHQELDSPQQWMHQAGRSAAQPPKPQRTTLYVEEGIEMITSLSSLQFSWGISKPCVKNSR